MDRNTIQKVLIGLFLLACIFIGIRTFDGNDINQNQSKPEVNVNVSSSRMTYGRFLEYLEMGWVKQVDLYDNSRNAIVQASSPELGNRPQSIRVEIPVGASQLIQKLKEYQTLLNDAKGAFNEMKSFYGPDHRVSKTIDEVDIGALNTKINTTITLLENSPSLTDSIYVPGKESRESINPEEIGRAHV